MMKTIDDEGGSGEMLRKVRAFADKRKGYSKAELNRLISLCERANFEPGVSHIIRLLAVPKGRQRETLQQRMIQGLWSIYSTRSTDKAI